MAGPTVDAAPEYYAGLTERHLSALWLLHAETSAPEPRAGIVPYLWRRDDYYPQLQRAGTIMAPGRGAERRVLQFANPGAIGRPGATHTLTAAVQLLLPGETAPPHRHTPAALRFIIQGDGAYTTVEGEQCVMHRHDLILTPSWTWHDHGNETAEPMMWLDGLDVPLVAGSLQCAFFEPYPADQQPVARPDGASVREFGTGHLRPAGPHRPRSTPSAASADAAVSPYSPLFIYRWADTRPALAALPDAECSPYDGAYLEYTHPLTGGHVMPTIASYVQMLRPGEQTRAHRHTTCAVYYVAEGTGTTTIDGQRFDWAAGDVLALPPWAWHAHANHSSDTPAILFSLADTPVYEALALYREQTAEGD